MGTAADVAGDEAAPIEADGEATPVVADGEAAPVGADGEAEAAPDGASGKAVVARDERGVASLRDTAAGGERGDDVAGALAGAVGATRTARRGVGRARRAVTAGRKS